MRKVNKMEFTSKELQTIMEALITAKNNILTYPVGSSLWAGYPSYEFKQERLKEVENIINKIRGEK